MPSLPLSPSLSTDETDRLPRGQLQFNAKQARREAQKAAKQDNELKKQIQNVRYPAILTKRTPPTA